MNYLMFARVIWLTFGNNISAVFASRIHNMIDGGEKGRMPYKCTEM